MSISFYFYRTNVNFPGHACFSSCLPSEPDKLRRAMNSGSTSTLVPSARCCLTWPRPPPCRRRDLDEPGSSTSGRFSNGGRYMVLCKNEGKPPYLDSLFHGKSNEHGWFGGTPIAGWFIKDGSSHSHEGSVPPQRSLHRMSGSCDNVLKWEKHMVLIRITCKTGNCWRV